MAKRFVDTGRYSDPWYRSLSPSLKCYWEYLISNCDLAGAWKKDFDLAHFQVGGERVERDEMLAAFNKGKTRIIEFADYMFIVDFVSFQYGTLSRDCRPHKSVLACLMAHGKRGLPKQYLKSALSGTSESEGDGRWQTPPRSFRNMVKKLSDKKGA